MTTLYRKNASGAVGSWTITASGSTLRFSSCQTLDGKAIMHVEEVEINRSGRSMEDQVKLRMNSRISKVRDKGYKDSVNEALASSSNQLDLLRPMLAQSWKKVKNPIMRGAVLQKKLDGHRCLITCIAGDVVAYSRQGKWISSINHILDELKDKIPEGVTLDGELYCHGIPLQTIASWVKREQVNTLRLEWVAYDLMDDILSYTDRHAALTSIVGQNNNSRVLEYAKYKNKDHVARALVAVSNAGFEGLIVRLDNYGYEAGKRSKSLLKVKRFFSGEFLVVAVIASKENWGKCICETDTGLSFTVSAPGNVTAKRKVLDKPSDYIGRKLTIEYACLTNKGVPFHASALRFLSVI